MVLETIKKREDFLRITKSNIKYFSKNIVITCEKIKDSKLINQDIYYIGYVVTKRIGNAVFRNKIKRRLRHIFKEHQELMNPNYYYIVFAKTNVRNSKFSYIERDVKFCLNSLKKKIR